MNYGELRRKAECQFRYNAHRFHSPREETQPRPDAAEEIPGPGAEEEGMLGEINGTAGGPTGQSLDLPLGGDSTQLTRSPSAQAE